VGGKLFHLPRMPRDEYLVRERAIRAYLDKKLGYYRIPRYYGDKADFGDMDVIVPTRLDWGDLREDIARELGVTETKSVGRVFSMAYDGLQTDLFAVAEKYVESTYTFMSFNDLGNLLGRICRRFNLKWGEEGLAYVYRRGADANYSKDLPITQDFARVCTFLGLDHATWIAGFPTLLSLYDWVVTCPYFSVVPYLDEPVGTIAKRTRDRPTIQKFVDYLVERGISARPELGDRHAHIEHVATEFPEANLLEQLAGEREREARSAAIAAKFSGDLVMRLRPELQGKALGEFIVAFKRSVGDFEAFVLATTPDEIEQRIRAFTAAGA
jgi:hypothetical protein